MENPSVELVIEPRSAVLTGDLRVNRILPFRARRMVGPFIFLDEMGPVHLRADGSGDVPPHPHIGLSTVTYLFTGELFHRDSLGVAQAIRPGDVNWMTAGRGIAHSERFARGEGHVDLHGLQAWVALPRADEEGAPTFEHYEASILPKFDEAGVEIHLIAGEAFGRNSPVRTHSPLFYFAATLTTGRTLDFTPPSESEAAFYIVRGSVEISGETFTAPKLIVFRCGENLKITATAETFGMFLGGEPFPEPRFIWWNFVSSSAGRIEAAKQAWLEQTFPKIPGETEFVPLP